MIKNHLRSPAKENYFSNIQRAVLIQSPQDREIRGREAEVIKMGDILTRRLSATRGIEGIKRLGWCVCTKENGAVGTGRFY